MVFSGSGPMARPSGASRSWRCSVTPIRLSTARRKALRQHSSDQCGAISLARRQRFRQHFDDGVEDENAFQGGADGVLLRFEKALRDERMNGGKWQGIRRPGLQSLKIEALPQPQSHQQHLFRLKLTADLLLFGDTAVPFADARSP